MICDAVFLVSEWKSWITTAHLLWLIILSVQIKYFALRAAVFLLSLNSVLLCYSILLLMV